MKQPHTHRKARLTVTRSASESGYAPNAEVVLSGAKSWPLHGIASSRRIEARMLKHWDGCSLMAWAGRRVASWVLGMAPHAQRIWVAAGPGGNGADGLFAAVHLAQRGKRVDISLHGTTLDRAPASSGTAYLQALEQALASGCVLRDEATHPAPDLVIDALLGLGANRALSPPLAQAVQAIQQLRRPCLSIDLPTGLDGETGQALGPDMIKAEATLSLLTLKPGLLMGEGRDAAGQVWFDRLDHSPLNDDERPLAQTICRPYGPGERPMRPHASHKGTFGDVVIVGGAPGMSGALRLAAHAALAAGAGRVIAVPLDPSSPLMDELRPECIWMRPQALLQDYPMEKATVVCGCGGGSAMQALLPAVMDRAKRLVLDADALNALAGQPSIAVALQSRAGRGLSTILTPHPLEAARLLQRSVSAVQASRLEAAQTLAAQYQATVVLKGSGTVVATPGEGPQVNVTGSGALAAGGTGDVLAGWMGGRWASVPAGTELRGEAKAQDAQEVRGSQVVRKARVSLQVHHTACSAVFEHGRVADRLGAFNAVRALDLVEQLRLELSRP
jgi:hydroxyethylthiazole kinase-like uncharacterized protein yjeF